MTGHQDVPASTNEQAPAVKRNRNPHRLNLEKLCRSCRKSRRGSAVVELAIVAPVFFAFTLGMIDVGRGETVQQILTTATREGARQAVLDGAMQSAVTTFITNYRTTAAVSAAGTAVTCSPLAADNSRLFRTGDRYGIRTFQSSELVAIANLP